MNKKITAAISAVMEYIRIEEESIAVQTKYETEKIQSPVIPIETTQIKLWGISGRQSQMHLRELIQLKALNHPK